MVTVTLSHCHSVTLSLCNNVKVLMYMFQFLQALWLLPSMLKVLVCVCACVRACACVHTCMCVCGVSPSPPSFHMLVASAETFVMGKIHKEIAMFMLEASEDGSRSEQSFVKVQARSMHHTLCGDNKHTPCVAIVTACPLSRTSP